VMIWFICLMIQLWKKFRGDDKPPAHLGSSKDYNIDMNPMVLIYSFYVYLFLILSLHYGYIWYFHHMLWYDSQFVWFLFLFFGLASSLWLMAC
jgi:hypothetical protein